MSTLELSHTLQTSQSRASGSDRIGLFRASGAAALLCVAFLPIQVLVFILHPLPETVNEWFALFQQSRLIGLLDLDLLLMADQALTILVYLALYFALKRLAPSFMLAGLTFGLVSAMLFIASNPAFSMLSLSVKYAAAATTAEKDVLLAAGAAAMAAWQGSAFHASYILGSLVPVLISVIMLRSSQFNRWTAYLGILSNVLALGLYVPGIGVFISVFSVLFLWVWYVLMARDLFRLGQDERLEAA